MSRKRFKGIKANLQIRSHSAGDNEHTHPVPTQPVINIPVSRYHSLPSGNLGRFISYQSVVVPQEAIASQSSNYPSYNILYNTLVPELDNSSTQLPQDEPWFDPAYIEHLDQTDMAPRQTRISDNPLKRWIPDQDTFVAEDIQWDGRGDYTDNVCPLCGLHPAVYRCEDCEGGQLLCKGCTVLSHKLNALHRVKLWNATFFEKMSLKTLGLRIQLGHKVGEGCSNPKSTFANDFVVLHVNGIHQVALDFCDCEMAQIPIIQLLRHRWFPATVDNPKSASTFTVLQQFHILSFESKASCFEYYHTLVRLTDNTSMESPKDRYSAFLRMVREYRHIKMLKRSGRGHDPMGAAGTKPGGCAVLCPACPQPKYNLPAGWESALPGQRWLYCLFLALDANFRLKRKHVSSSIADPALGDGMSYFVQRNDYMDFVNTFGKLIIQDPSTCSNHKAVDAERSTKGLAATGVGTIDCARHDVKQPISVGDLQKSERYVNMDYLYFTSLKDTPLVELVVSYDIACQWSVKLWDRMGQYPQHLHCGPSDKRSISFLVPKFHLPAHIMSCQTAFSFNFNLHVGCTDGEAPERGWSHINPVAMSTREMGPGSRQDTLDDHFGDWNWKKTTLMGISLLRKIQVAVAECNEHTFRYHQFEAGLNATHVEQWSKELDLWLQDHRKQNPFEPHFKPLTQNLVRRELANQDAAELANGTAYVLHETVSASQMVMMGIDLENQQRRLAVDSAELGPHSTDIQHAQIQVRRNMLKRKIDTWISIQHLYIPSLSMVRAQSAGDQPEDPAERVSLILPSSMDRHIPCDPRLCSIEWKLRKSQANDALDDLREGLRLRAYLYIDKDRFLRGQRHNTRSRGVIEQVNVKVDAAALKYRVARDAIYPPSTVLGIVGWEAELPPLLGNDIKQLSGDDNETEGHRSLSWIWTRLGDTSQLNEEKHLQDVLRIEWCKTKSRAERWSEEVQLLLEEMRQVLQFFTSRAEEWERRAQGMCFVTSQPSACEGLASYSARQASLFRALNTYCQRLWRFVPHYVELGGMVDVIPPEITREHDEEI